MGLKSIYFYFEYIAIHIGRESALFLLGRKGEKLFNRYLVWIFNWKNKFLHHLDNKRSLKDARGNFSPFFGGDGIKGKNITIIIPIYNAYEELKDCLESLVNKTQPPYRLLLIDDASTDVRIRPLLEQYERVYPYVTTAFNSKNSGYTATINKGCTRYPVRCSNPSSLIRIG